VSFTDGCTSKPSRIASSLADELGVLHVADVVAVGLLGDARAELEHDAALALAERDIGAEVLAVVELSGSA
jgi:hypothetical protein